MTVETHDDVVVDLREVRAHRLPPARALGREELLREVALALTSTLDLREILRTLADLALEASGADRASIFLLDGASLEPTVAIGRQRDEELWASFQEMGPIAVREVGASWQRLRAGRVVEVRDAAAAEVVPRRWLERFRPVGVVLAPLHDGTQLHGVLAVDASDPAAFAADVGSLLGAIGAYAGIAVRNAASYAAARRQARFHEALARAAAGLVTGQQPADLAASLADACVEVVGAASCLIALFDLARGRITTVAARGMEPVPTPQPLAAVPAVVLEPLQAAWAEDPHRAVTFVDQPWLSATSTTPGVRRHVVVPLLVHGRPRGAVVLGFRSADPNREELGAARTLADLAAAALERVVVLDRSRRHARQMEALYQLSSAAVEGDHGEAVVERLNGLLEPHGIQVCSLAVRDRTLAGWLPAVRPVRVERESWKAGGGPVLMDDGSLSVPMKVGQNVVGALRVKPSVLEDDDLAFVEAVARGLAEVATHGVLRMSLERAERERAIATERDRIAADIHDTVGQLLVAIGLVARRSLQQVASDSTWAQPLRRIADLADSGKWELDQAIRALTFVPATGRALPAALAELARSFEIDSGITVLTDVRGDGRVLPAQTERALYRVAHEALANAWRHARCAVIRVELRYGASATTLTVSDDGTGFVGSRTAPMGVGTASMRRAIAEVGGDLTIRNGDPRGVVVRARVPRRDR